MILIRRLVSSRLALERLLQCRVVAGIKVQMVLVDVNDFDALFLALEREGVTRFHGFGVVDGALPMAVVQLGRPDQREEAGGDHCARDGGATGSL